MVGSNYKLWIILCGWMTVVSVQADEKKTDQCVVYNTKSETRERCSIPKFDERIKINELQFLGSHNSYKRRITAKEEALYQKWRPQSYKKVTYDHQPLHKQLNAGVRYLEFDVYRDPDGTRFISPIIASITDTPLPEDYKNKMGQPGLKVMHVKDRDYLSHCLTFQECLSQLKDWSDSSPGHFPLFVVVEVKEWLSQPNEIPSHPDHIAELNFDSHAIQAIDQDILKVFPREQIIAPGDLVDGYKNLRAMARAEAWPTISEAWGKIFFLVLESTSAVKHGEQSVVDRYVDNYGYDKMLMFPLFRDDRSPHAAFVNLHKKKLSDLRKKIRKFSKRGYMVRARADVDTVEARQGDRGRWATVMKEGANIVVTDFIWPHPNFGYDYFVRINDPGVIARCSPLRQALCHVAN